MNRYQVFVSDYDGTLAEHGTVATRTVRALEELKMTDRKLVLVTGRRMEDLRQVFPQYKLFDFIVAENGAVIHFTDTGREELLGPPPEKEFVEALNEEGVAPLAVGRVILATWIPHDKTVLEVIRRSGREHQVIFNRGAVMILPPGVNKATGLSALMDLLNLSVHNVVSVGDAENDTALLQASECAVAVRNAIPSLQEVADLVLSANNGEGICELIERLKRDDLADLAGKLGRHRIPIGKRAGSDQDYFFDPYRSGLLISGSSGGGKSTFAAAFTETLNQKGYQYCLIDPEGDYLELPDVMTVGNEKSVPTTEEIVTLLLNPENNVVICTLSVPIADRPAFFAELSGLLADLRREYAHPHWILVDEAHHFMNHSVEVPQLPEDLCNFMIISNAPNELPSDIIRRVGTVALVGGIDTDLAERLHVLNGRPSAMPALKKGHAFVWDAGHGHQGTVVKLRLPVSRPHRHKKKYALGDLKDKSFFFTGKDKKMNLKASNLIMFADLAEGIDDGTWRYHLNRKDFYYWFNDSIKDKKLVNIVETARHEKDLAESKRIVVNYIRDNYTA